MALGCLSDAAGSAAAAPPVHVFGWNAVLPWMAELLSGLVRRLVTACMTLLAVPGLCCRGVLQGLVRCHHWRQSLLLG